MVDDAAYYQLARQISEHPFDPYGFAMAWRNVPMPAMLVLAPAAFPYWWGAGIAIFGDDPVLWKLWAFPFALVLCASLRDLLRRFAPGHETPLLALCVLSPALLPHVNLMLDVPALALVLGAMALFLRACDRDSAGLAALAGVVAGLAMQTKYPAVFGVSALAVYAVSARRVRLGIVCLGAATAIFAAWETALAFRYGQSHFIVALLEGQGSKARHPLGELFVLMLTVLGGSAPVLGLLAALGLRVRLRWISGAALAVAVAFAIIPLLPGRPIAALMFEPRFTLRNLEIFLFLPLGVAVVGVAGAAVARSLRDPGVRGSPPRQMLLGWVALELVGIVWMTPFMAVRRLMGLITALTLLLGSLLPPPPHRRSSALVWIAAFGAALTAIHWGAGFFDARARAFAAPRIEATVHDLGGDPARETIWVAGHWGYQFYTERLGMRQLVAGRSVLESGDWVVTARYVARQQLPKISGLSPPLAVFDVKSPWPWSAIPYAYAGAMPLRSQPDAQLRISIQRVIEGSKLARLSPRDLEADRASP